MRRVVQGLGLAGGILGLVWGVFGPLVQRSPNLSRAFLLVAGAAGFIIGPAWQWPGMLLLVAGGLAVAADR